MTIKEAIKILKSKMDGHTDTSYEWAETVRMAIKALEQEHVLDNIRAEIEHTAKDYDKFDDYRRVHGLWIALEIIDKYKAESEDKGMTLDETICYIKKVAEEKEELYGLCGLDSDYCDGTKDCKVLKNGENKGCIKGVKECKQLAEWLEELKQLREQQTYDDYISRQAVIEAFCNLDVELRPSAIDAITDMIKSIPSVAPQPKMEKGKPCEMTVEEYRERMIQAFHNADTDELIAICVQPTEKEFKHLEWLLEKHYKKEPWKDVDVISRKDVIKILSDEIDDMVKQYRAKPKDNPRVDAMACGIHYINWCLNTLKRLPFLAMHADTIQPNTSQWINKTKVNEVYDITGVKTWGMKCQCERCGFETIIIEDFGYYDHCPKCGAKMQSN